MVANASIILFYNINFVIYIHITAHGYDIPIKLCLRNELKNGLN